MHHYFDLIKFILLFSFEKLLILLFNVENFNSKKLFLIFWDLFFHIFQFKIFLMKNPTNGYVNLEKKYSSHFLIDLQV